MQLLNHLLSITNHLIQNNERGGAALGGFGDTGGEGTTPNRVIPEAGKGRAPEGGHFWDGPSPAGPQKVWMFLL